MSMSNKAKGRFEVGVGFCNPGTCFELLEHGACVTASDALGMTGEGDNPEDYTYTLYPRLYEY